MLCERSECSTGVRIEILWFAFFIREKADFLLGFINFTVHQNPVWTDLIVPCAEISIL